MRTRDVLNECQVYRDRCVAEGRLVPYPFDRDIQPPPSTDSTIEQAWNEHRSTVSLVVPTEEPELARVLCSAIGACSSELGTGHTFQAEADGRFIPVEIHDCDEGVERILIGVCNKRRKVAGSAGKSRNWCSAGRSTVVVVRSTAYPSNPRTVVGQLLEKLANGGGRRVVVEDSDWRTMLAFEGFRVVHEAAELAAWQMRSRPLTSLDSLRAILDLDRLAATTSAVGSLVTHH